MLILKVVGSSRAICRNVLLKLSVTLQKLTAERNYFDGKLKYVKSKRP